MLVVDDNADVRELLKVAFRDAFDVLEAADGLAAYALACAHRPSVICLDIAMPMVDGWTVLRKLRANSNTKDIPIVIFTALDLQAVRPQAMAFGVKAVLRKPASKTDLEAAIQRALGRR